MPIAIETQTDGTIAVCVDDYRVMIRKEGIRVESSDGAPIAHTVPLPASETHIPALTGDLVRTWRPDDRSVTFEWLYARRDPEGSRYPHEREEHRVVTRMTVSNDVPLIRIAATDAITAETPVKTFAVAWEFLAGPEDGSRPDFVWTPALCPKPGQVIGQHFYRSPAAIVQHGSISCALVPDLDLIDAEQPLRSYLDLQCPRDEPGPARLIAGVGAYRLDGHVYHTTDGVEPVRLHDTALRFGCELHVDVHTPPRRAHQSVSRYHWARYGREWLRDIRPQVLPFAGYFDYGYHYADEHLWRETVIDGPRSGAPRTGPQRVGAMCIGREYPNDVWFQGWFNQLRTAYGLYSWATRLDDVERRSCALATRELLLSAPSDRGLFPTIGILPGDDEPEGGVRWVASTLQGGGPDLYNLQDCSWTAWWLLRWHEDLVPDERTLPFCQRYADALLRLQRPDGGWPTYVDVATQQVVTRYDATEAAKASSSDYAKALTLERKEWGSERLPVCAESAASAFFLAELSRIVPNGQAYLAAAERGAAFLEEHVIPEHKWFDYETFFSCSPKPIDFYDARTQQHPQNTLSLFWAAECFRVLHEITGKAEYSELASSLMDYLCLYQQVWSPPFLSMYAFGGFGVMNTDGEWNDARQALCADGLASHYLDTGRREYLERAIAATRASFACAYIPENAGICPKMYDIGSTGYSSENYAHGGWDAVAYASGFDWGIGSALTTAARMLDRFGDPWIDVPGSWALGVDALTVTDCRTEDGVWCVTVEVPLRHTQAITIKGNPGREELLALAINDCPPVIVSATQLRDGVRVPVHGLGEPVGHT